MRRAAVVLATAGLGGRTKTAARTSPQIESVATGSHGNSSTEREAETKAKIMLAIRVRPVRMRILSRCKPPRKRTKANAARKHRGGTAVST
jgi:hypothetical protein